MQHGHFSNPRHPLLPGGICVPEPLSDTLLPEPKGVRPVGDVVQLLKCSPRDNVGRTLDACFSYSNKVFRTAPAEQEASIGIDFVGMRVHSTHWFAGKDSNVAPSGSLPSMTIIAVNAGSPFS